MYCSKCGNELNEEQKFCSKCGTPVNGRIIENNGIYENNSATNGFALASCICSIIGLFIYGILLGIVAIVLGIIAQQNNLNEKSRNQAMSGIILGVIDIVATMLIAQSWISWLYEII